MPNIYVAVAFVGLFVSLAIELNLFAEEERGGLLTEDTHEENALHYLVHFVADDDDQRNVDTTCLAVMIRLRQSGLFKREDVQHHGLVRRICTSRYFSEQKFRFLIEWCLESLIQIDGRGELLLHLVVGNDQKFRLVLDAVFRYYPR